jgi:hypothetical protein
MWNAIVSVDPTDGYFLFQVREEDLQASRSHRTISLYTDWKSSPNHRRRIKVSVDDTDFMDHCSRGPSALATLPSINVIVCT